MAGIRDDATDKYKAAKEAEDDGVAGPGPVRRRAIMGFAVAAAEDEEAEGGEEEECVF